MKMLESGVDGAALPLTGMRELVALINIISQRK